jgi:Rod binding domain-containing protein
MMERSVPPAATANATPAARDPSAGATRLKAAAQEFEAVLIGKLLEGVGPTPGVVGIGGAAGDVYGSFLRDEYARLIARAGGLGLADAIERSLAERGRGR